MEQHYIPHDLRGEPERAADSPSGIAYDDGQVHSRAGEPLNVVSAAPLPNTGDTRVESGAGPSLMMGNLIDQLHAAIERGTVEPVQHAPANVETVGSTLPESSGRIDWGV